MNLVLLLAVPLLLSLPGTFTALVEQLRTTPVPARNALVRSFLAGKRLPLIEADTVLTYVWYGRADSVFVNGSLQGGWRRPERLHVLPCGNDTSLFHLGAHVPADALLEYQYIIDGRAVLDPGNVRATPDGDFRNSQVAMPHFRPERWILPDPAVPHGSLDTLQFTPTDRTLAPRSVVVYRPVAPAPPGGYPVAFVHDGTTALAFLRLTVAADNMIAAREIPPFIAVFVPSVDRVDEYRGVKQVRYLDALADELVPLIERRYGTARDPFRRASMGISNGGHFALLSTLLRDDVFGLCAGQSSTIDPDLLVAVDLRMRCGTFPARARFFQQCGLFDIVSAEYHFLQRNRLFAERLARTGAHHRYRETSDGHDWPSWRERIPEILRFLFNPVP